jgi:hypothetical protein
MRGRSGARSVSRYDALIVELVRLAALRDSLRVNATVTMTEAGWLVRVRQEAAGAAESPPGPWGSNSVYLGAFEQASIRPLSEDRDRATVVLLLFAQSDSDWLYSLPRRLQADCADDAARSPRPLRSGIAI